MRSSKNGCDTLLRYYLEKVLCDKGDYLELRFSSHIDDTHPVGVRKGFGKGAFPERSMFRGRRESPSVEYIESLTIV